VRFKIHAEKRFSAAPDDKLHGRLELDHAPDADPFALWAAHVQRWRDARLEIPKKTHISVPCLGIAAKFPPSASGSGRMHRGLVVFAVPRTRMNTGHAPASETGGRSRAIPQKRPVVAERRKFGSVGVRTAGSPVLLWPSFYPRPPARPEYAHCTQRRFRGGRPKGFSCRAFDWHAQVHPSQDGRRPASVLARESFRGTALRACHWPCAATGLSRGATAAKTSFRGQPRYGPSPGNKCLGRRPTSHSRQLCNTRIAPNAALRWCSRPERT